MSKLTKEQIQVVSNYLGTFNTTESKVINRRFREDFEPYQSINEIPTTGLMPKKTFENKCIKERVESIMEACEICLQNNKPFPQDWVLELISLIRSLT